MKKVYLLIYSVDVILYKGEIEYFVFAKSLKEAKANVKHTYNNEKFVSHKVFVPTKKHQFHTNYKEQL